MAQPQWITPAGSLGTIPEGVFYSTPIEADAGAETVYYQLIAGQLPNGIQITTSGLIVGVPKNIVNVQGVPAQVNEDVTSKFAVRAYTTKVVDGVIIVDRLADRTFTVTVSGENAPEFVTPAGNIGTYYDGTQVSLQVDYVDADPGDQIRITVIGGELPPGLFIDNTGLISGVIAPLVGPPDTAPAGFDATPFSQYAFDFSTRSASKNYQFNLEISDGKQSNVRTFEIYVYSKDSMSADTTDFTADNTWITADVVPTRTPVLLNASGSLGRIRSDNFYAYRFIGIDFDGDPLEYVIDSPPPGLTLNSESGWLYGYIPDLGATEYTYDFTISVRKIAQPTIVSSPYPFSMTLIGPVDTEVTWLTNSNLGTINNGAVSTLYVEAINTIGRQLQYQLDSGAYNRLPPGLELLPSGNIVGTVSFNTFALDGGTTTFDRDLRTRAVTHETTFDMSYTFTVNAYAPGSVSNIISVFKTFTVTVIRAFNEPYEGLYIKAMPPEPDRALIAQLVQNQDLIPVDYVYRNGDPNFGVSSSIVYNHAFGLNAASIDDYIQSLDINHYWKNLTLGSIEYAQARNSAGEVIYEAVYSRVIDNLVNNQGESVGKSVNIPYPIGGPDSTEITTVYPNSLDNMRNQVIDVVGQISPMLPAWMTSKQPNGRVLGFVPAWVIAYVKPGRGAEVVYNIQTRFGEQLNLIDFKVDRYELNRRSTFAWDPQDNQWIPQPPAATTFDLNVYTNINWINNSSNIVEWVNTSEQIVNWGNPSPGPGTTFDLGSTTFITPAPTVVASDEFDKYLVFPRINILG